MADQEELAKVVEDIAEAETWERRIGLIRLVPEKFGTSLHQNIYSSIAKKAYITSLGASFAYVHWRDEYELETIERAYALAESQTSGFTDVSDESITRAILRQPTTLRIFRLLLALTTQEFSASTAITASQLAAKALSKATIESIEDGRAVPKEKTAVVLAVTINQAMRGELFAKIPGEVRNKINKPDTLLGWQTVSTYARERVPLPMFLHQRYYGGYFRQLLDATSGKRGDILEDAVEGILTDHKIPHVRTGSDNQKAIAEKFGLTVKPAPDFVLHTSGGSLRAILECKQANDGGTARDKAARFRALRAEASRLGGIPVFAVLGGLGWKRTADALGPVIRDTDGRVLTLSTLDEIITIEPIPSLIGSLQE